MDAKRRSAAEFIQGLGSALFGLKGANYVVGVRLEQYDPERRNVEMGRIAWVNGLAGRGFAADRRKKLKCFYRL
ncbi:MAG: hypothetical protein COS39_06815 [Hydrogenophilales bacterium CG03_land_8_20_14_0_80_62_28]|nr:hypothetical protein [Betaproteobacteria bacterium]OIO78565.1 MAG: hypothetical protein AUJ86_04090 [Hydrogenophilaceae bacterium CG1_02_62_390]PIV22755.1 MAG: hypothetical protein COS39_06815 [Hydrogenophilales bacterium CG03_land_8_20_14_0_80_62_28]PIW39134.1 MAG: hypothetical protein COW23_03415 [Hydrogenophilales bacterium CG15_BIG_FIL_POST_REV_8_21_14_020_62_31]PIX00576.1 MAG: hypothetical protein COZ79_11495 [Hydrogenophilales bacterium CG_4_8_14_3_um_filter_62_83]